ncbi:alpha/beta fold hydrolase [Streptomyces chiangmaiensis]|uniref:Alpha/beta fold hydrolase n=1 Tax=Streptomyces chiangmaiensis TaxID=766497 RepID=A0ABU7FMH5_9ACTN|nr:alpha/beta fold hydrolase [Streptomyces chiangmaiensis]MED7825154.1 alpha/beta fold hydrolase [Streptomyces chiangmaiensis]
MRRPRALATVALAAGVLMLSGTCTSTAQDRAAAPAAGSGGLSGVAACPGLEGFSCGTLTVPLDHSGGVQGRLDLRVAAADNVKAPKGVLLFLTGGPGQPGVPFVEGLSKKLTPLLKDYRLVMIDQRGTGAGALQCPQLQKEMGSSDLTPPTAQAVTACAAAVGPDRRFYSTGDTVADLELLRRALGVRKMTLDGVSYGTYTAERYALAYPQHVGRMVLDSVVPQTGYDPMDRAAMRAAPRVLTTACEAIGCRTDPAADLAKVVDTYDNGADVLDALTTWEFVDPNYAAMIDALHQAAGGDPTALRGLIAGVRQGSAATAEELSQGLHASTLCLDGRYPWGRADTPVAGRQEALEKAAADLTPADYGPFDAATATGLGSMLSCLHWPRTPVPPLPPEHRRLPGVPVLLLGGDRDLSTPLEWLYDQKKLTPRARVVVVPGAAHSVQSRAASDKGRQAVFDFLLTR